MNLEEVFAVLKGKSRSRGRGARFDVVEHWFQRCGIIDGRLVDRGLFVHSYERLCPNREDLGLVQLIQLFGILSRESRQPVEVLVTKFNTVKQTMVDEIREMWLTMDSSAPVETISYAGSSN